MMKIGEISQGLATAPGEQAQSDQAQQSGRGLRNGVEGGREGDGVDERLGARRSHVGEIVCAVVAGVRVIVRIEEKTRSREGIYRRSADITRGGSDGPVCSEGITPPDRLNCPPTQGGRSSSETIEIIGGRGHRGEQVVRASRQAEDGPTGSGHQ